MTRRTVFLSLSIAALAFATLGSAPDAEAGRRWRWARSSGQSNNSTYQAYRRSLRPSTRVTYSGVSRAEQDYWRRRDAWYNHAFNGWKPEDFR